MLETQDDIADGVASVLLDNSGNKIRLSDYIIEGADINKIFYYWKKLYHSNPLWLSINELKTILSNNNVICNHILEEKHLDILLKKSLRPSLIESYLNLACKLYPNLSYRACSSSDKKEEEMNTSNNNYDFCNWKNPHGNKSSMIPSDYVTKVRQKLLEFRTQHTGDNGHNKVDKFELSKLDDCNNINSYNDNDTNSVINSLRDVLYESFDAFQVEEKEARRLLDKVDSHTGTEYTEASVLQDSRLILDIRQILENAYNIQISSTSSSSSRISYSPSHRRTISDKYESSPSTDSEVTINADPLGTDDYPEVHIEQRRRQGDNVGSGDYAEIEAEMGIMKHQDILPCLLLSECFGCSRVRRLCARALFVASDEYLRAASNDSDMTGTSTYSEAMMCAGVFCEIVKVADLREDAVAQAVLAIGRYFLAHGLPTVVNTSGDVSDDHRDGPSSIAEGMGVKKNGEEEILDDGDRWSDDGFYTDSDGSLDDEGHVDRSINVAPIGDLLVNNEVEGTSGDFEDLEGNVSPFRGLLRYQDISPLHITDLRHEREATATTASDNGTDVATDIAINNIDQMKRNDEHDMIDDSFDASGSLDISYVSYTDSLDTSSSSSHASSIPVSVSQVSNRLPFSNHTTPGYNMKGQEEKEKEKVDEQDSDTHIRVLPIPTPYPHPHHLAIEDDASPTNGATVSAITSNTSSQHQHTKPKVDVASTESELSTSPKVHPSVSPQSLSQSDSQEEIARRRAAQRVRSELRRRSLEETLQVAARSQRRDRLKSVQLRASVIRVNTASNKSNSDRPLSASLSSGLDQLKRKNNSAHKGRGVAFGSASVRSSPFNVTTTQHQLKLGNTGYREDIEESFDKDISMSLCEQKERKKHNLRGKDLDRLTTPTIASRLSMNACVDKDNLEAEDARRRAADRVRDHRLQKERRAELEAAAKRMKDQKKWLDRDRRIAKFRSRINSSSTRGNKIGSRNNNINSERHAMGIDVSTLRFDQPTVPLNDTVLHGTQAEGTDDVPIDWTYMGPSAEALQAVGLAPLPADDLRRAELWNSVHDALAQGASTIGADGHVYTQDKDNVNQNNDENNQNISNMSNEMKVEISMSDDLMVEANRVQSIIDRTLSRAGNVNDGYHQFSRDSLLNDSLAKDERDDSGTDFDLLQVHESTHIIDDNDNDDVSKKMERERDMDSVSSLGLSSFCIEPASQSLVFPLINNRAVPSNNAHHEDADVIKKESEGRCIHVRVGRAWGISFSDHDHSSTCHAEVSLEPLNISHGHDNDAPVLIERTEYKTGAAPCFESDLIFKLPVTPILDIDDEANVDLDTLSNYLVVVRLYLNSAAIQDRRSSRYNIHNNIDNKSKKEPLGRAALPLSELLADSEHNAGGPALVLPLCPMDETGHQLKNAAAGAGFLELEARES